MSGQLISFSRFVAQQTAQNPFCRVPDSPAWLSERRTAGIPGSVTVVELPMLSFVLERVTKM